MMPSRGVRIAPRAFQMQCRNFSSRRIPPPSIRNAIVPTSSPTSPWRRRTPFLVSSIQTARNASTQPSTPISSSTTSTIDSSTTAPIAAEPTSAFPNMDTITLDSIDLSNPDIPTRIAAIPEHLGYLKEIGLNYGWGPTSMLEWSIEHFHIVAGLPWWGSIAATAICLRLLLLPLFIRSSDATARGLAITPLTKPITERMQLAQKEKRTEDMAAAWQELRAVRKNAGVSMRVQLTPMLLQGVFGFCGFKLLRACAALPVPGFTTGGFLWLQDLTVPDPYLILPVLMAGSIHMLIRMGGETGASTTDQFTPGMHKFMLYGMPGLVLLGTGWVPGGLCVFLCAGGALGVAQSLTLQRPAVREWLGIAPVYKPRRGEAPKHVLEQFAENANPFAKRQSADPAKLKNAAPRRTEPAAPIWQAPTLRRNDGKIIDVKPIIKTAPAPPASAAGTTQQTFTPKGTPSAPGAAGAKDASAQGGIMSRAKAALRDNAEGRRTKAEADSLKTAAEAYEKRAQEKKKMGRGGRR